MNTTTDVLRAFVPSYVVDGFAFPEVPEDVAELLQAGLVYPDRIENDSPRLTVYKLTKRGEKEFYSDMKSMS